MFFALSIAQNPPFLQGLGLHKLLSNGFPVTSIPQASHDSLSIFSQFDPKEQIGHYCDF